METCGLIAPLNQEADVRTVPARFGIPEGELVNVLAGRGANRNAAEQALGYIAGLLPHNTTEWMP